MLDLPPRENRTASWLFVAIWTLVIYVTIFFGREIQRFVYATWGRDAFLIFVVVSIAAGIALAFRSLRAGGGGNFRNVLSLAAVACAYGAGTYHLRHNPEEAVHFVEYGVLSLLLYRALIHRNRNVLVFVAASFACASLGAIDEMIQWLVPRRFFDFRDIWVNVAGGVLMQLALALGLRPKCAGSPVTVQSIRTTARLGMVFFAILLAFSSNTLQRQDQCAKTQWLPAWLKVADGDLMAEYGCRHRIDGAAFSSRLSLEQIRQEDGREPAWRGELLNQHQNRRGYDVMLSRYGPLSDPFLYELRVRLFRRDMHVASAKRTMADAAALKYHATIAYREQQIVDTFMPQTFAAATAYAWKPEIRSAVTAFADTSSKYTSPVSGHLITSFSERELQALLLLVIAAIFALERAAVRTRFHHVDKT